MGKMESRDKEGDDRRRSGWLVDLGGVLALAGAVLAASCNSLRLTPSLAEKTDRPERNPLLAAPGKRSLALGPYVFLSDFELSRESPLFRELAGLRDQVYGELQLPPTKTVIQVYIFENRERYERFMGLKYPDLPKRRAFFVAQPHGVGAGEDLLVYTFWGERLREDLRHELTHALLHSVLKEVPLWLDEGLAEYFEAPPERGGINDHHLEQIRSVPADAFKPDLAHLEELSQVQQMTPAEYREAWAWVHLLLRDRPAARAVLLVYLQQLRSNPNPGLLQARLARVYPHPEEALCRHLARLDLLPAAQGEGHP